MAVVIRTDCFCCNRAVVCRPCVGRITVLVAKCRDLYDLCLFAEQCIGEDCSICRTSCCFTGRCLGGRRCLHSLCNNMAAVILTDDPGCNGAVICRPCVGRFTVLVTTRRDCFRYFVCIRTAFKDDCRCIRPGSCRFTARFLCDRTADFCRDCFCMRCIPFTGELRGCTAVIFGPCPYRCSPLMADCFYIYFFRICIFFAVEGYFCRIDDQSGFLTAGRCVFLCNSGVDSVLVAAVISAGECYRS